MDSASASTAIPAELTEAECKEVLERNGLGRLACYSPSTRECYVVPVAYVYHPGAVFLALVPGQKLTYLAEHPEGVCFEVEQVEGGEDWKTVIVTGDFKRVGVGESVDEAKRGPLRTVFDIGLAPYAHGSQVLCKIDIRRMTGRHDRWVPVAPSADRLS